MALDLENKQRVSKPVANVRCKTCPKPGKTCPDIPAAALLEGREHTCEVVVSGHSHGLTEEPLRRRSERGRTALPMPVIELPLLNDWWRRQRGRPREKPDDFLSDSGLYSSE